MTAPSGFPESVLHVQTVDAEGGKPLLQGRHVGRLQQFLVPPLPDGGRQVM